MKKIPKYRTVSNPFSMKSDYETNTEPSVTVQGDSYTIAELLHRSQNGAIPHIKRTGQFHEDPTHETDVRIDAPDFDLADATTIKAEIEEKQKQTIADKEKKIADKKEAEAIKRYNEVVEQEATASEKPLSASETRAPANVSDGTEQTKKKNGYT